MKILSVGNSFSQDAVKYLHQLADSCGIELDTANLFIGGCPLSEHHRNMLSENRVYSYELNGSSSYIKVSLKEALLATDWDVVTLQQESLRSADYSTFQPYLNTLADYVRIHVPKAKIAMHQTWGYDDKDARLSNRYANGSAMFADVEASYKKAAEDINADILIKSGKAFELLKENGVANLFRGCTSHAGLGTGRYALGLVWLKTITGADVKNVGKIKLDEEISDQDLETVRILVSEFI